MKFRRSTPVMTHTAQLYVVECQVHHQNKMIYRCSLLRVGIVSAVRLLYPIPVWSLGHFPTSAKTNCMAHGFHIGLQALSWTLEPVGLAVSPACTCSWTVLNKTV